MWRSRRERELDKELRFHIESQVEENLRRGMPPVEARRQAMLMFGSQAEIKEECREVRPLYWLGVIGADARYAARTLRASSVFTLTAILSIALGVGANAAIFTLLHAALWRPLPAPRPSELFHLVRSDGVEDHWSYSWALFEELRDAAAPFGTLIGRGSAGLRKFSAGGTEPMTGPARRLWWSTRRLHANSSEAWMHWGTSWSTPYPSWRRPRS
ncbi:MAG TPA: permease prefix domain 1-containing protein [Bryobacteraceae bacterium]|nr:permease prefix domain 1-containing protein [Bryobacteraceae bacterium]